MLDRIYTLSSLWSYFIEEGEHLKSVFRQLQYLGHLTDSTIERYVKTKTADTAHGGPRVLDDVRVCHFTIPYKDQPSADTVRKRLSHLGNTINKVLCPLFTSRKVGEDLKIQEEKPDVINQFSVVYEFKCDLCDSSYID